MNQFHTHDGSNTTPNHTTPNQLTDNSLLTRIKAALLLACGFPKKTVILGNEALPERLANSIGTPGDSLVQDIIKEWENDSEPANEELTD